MKTKVAGLIVFTMLIAMQGAYAADVADLKGTWSGSWQPAGGAPDAVTVEIQEEGGKLSGKFRTPLPLDFSKVTFDAKTAAVAIVATDSKSGKQFRIDGKLDGLEIRGSMTQGDTKGTVMLIKWTYVPRL